MTQLAAPANVLVQFSHVSKSYDGVNLVVRDLDLDVFDGEFLSLLGPSGCGKTTTLMMLAGFERPSAGSIYLRNKLLDDIPSWRRGIGVVFQSYALFPHMSVAENIAFPLHRRARPTTEIRERVNAMLALVQLETLADRRPAQLSGGQQQRVALARALVFDPALVLLDEPLGALDKRLREQMQLELKRLHARIGVTMIYVTHDQGEALAMSDRVAVFMEGRLRQIATPSELYERPADAMVADFVGENNRMAGTVESAQAARCSVRLTNGQLVHVPTSSKPSAGTAATLSLRPERLLLARADCSSDHENRMPAQVREIIYLGDHARVEVQAGEQILIAKIPNDARQTVPAIGDAVVAIWRASDCQIFLDHASKTQTQDTP